MAVKTKIDLPWWLELRMDVTVWHLGKKSEQFNQTELGLY
jgi:hypothetical protein